MKLLSFFCRENVSCASSGCGLKGEKDKCAVCGRPTEYPNFWGTNKICGRLPSRTPTASHSVTWRLYRPQYIRTMKHPAEEAKQNKRNSVRQIVFSYSSVVSGFKEIKFPKKFIYARRMWKPTDRHRDFNGLWCKIGWLWHLEVYWIKSSLYRHIIYSVWIHGVKWRDLFS